jgi:hypothetical protein
LTSREGLISNLFFVALFAKFFIGVRNDLVALSAMVKLLGRIMAASLVFDDLRWGIEGVVDLLSFLESIFFG